MFELYQLRQFLAVVEHETVSKEADALNMTQPALSRSLQNLEYELQLPLFDRGKNKITLNDSGRWKQSSRTPKNSTSLLWKPLQPLSSPPL